MKSEHKIRRRLQLFSALNFLGLVLLWSLQNFASERFWPLAVFIFLLQAIFALPAFAIGILAWRRQARRIAALQILALAFWFALVSGFCFPPVFAARNNLSGSKPISVMTYNIRSGSLGIEKVVAIIATQNPDVVMLQEAEAHGGYPDPIPKLQAALRNYHMTRHQELAIFSRFPISEKHYHALPKHQVGILEARLDVRGKPLTVLCAHFSNPLNGGPRNWLRKISLQAAFRSAQADLLIRLAERASTPVLIGGDFNTPPRGSLYRQISKHFRDGLRASSWGFGNTFPAFLPVARLDYFWTNSSARITRCRVLAARASDHRPLVAELFIP